MAEMRTGCHKRYAKLIHDVLSLADLLNSYQLSRFQFRKKESNQSRN